MTSYGVFFASSATHVERIPLTDNLQPQEVDARMGLDRTSPDAMARMRFDLHWESGSGRHTDCLVFGRVNLRRDIVPAALEPELEDRPVGHRASFRFSPGELVQGPDDGRLVRIRQGQFDRRFLRRGSVEPRVGRFYPRGMLQGVNGVLRMDRHPFRMAMVDDDALLVDLNHPLADIPLTLELEIQDIWAPRDERGGRRNEIADAVCADGPGMQARWRGVATDFWSDLPYLRTDPGPDAAFYAKPRLVDHLDATAITQVRGLYRRLLPKGGRILDLMSSWHSHLPEEVGAGHVTGLGMNWDELRANPVLDERLVHDLNLEPSLPFPDGSFDAAVCTVSVEYLTRPLDVFREVARVLRPGCPFVVTFSNRWFPPKVIRVWEGIHEFERPGMVGELFLRTGLFTRLETWSIRGLPRPDDDKYAPQMPLSDPIYGVWAQRLAS